MSLPGEIRPPQSDAPREELFFFLEQRNKRPQCQRIQGGNVQLRTTIVSRNVDSLPNRTASRSGRGDISLLDEYSCAKIDSIREIAGWREVQETGGIHGDVLLA